MHRPDTTCSSSSTGQLVPSVARIISTTSFSDHFERPDSTVLGRAWVEGARRSGYRHRQAPKQPQEDAAPRGAEFPLLGRGARRRRIRVEQQQPAPAFGLLFGYVNPGNYYAAYRHVGGSSLLKIVRVSNGVETVLAQRSIANPLPGQEFSVAVTFSQSQIVLTAAGASVFASGVSVTPGSVASW